MNQKKILAKIAVTVTFLFIVYRKLSFEALVAIISEARLALLGPVFILLFINTSLNTFKWRILLTLDDTKVSFPRLLSSYLKGTFFNLFMPSSIGGDAYRIYSIGKYTEKMSESAASVFAERLSGFAALSLIGLTAAIIGLNRAERTALIFVPLLLLTALVVIILLMFKPNLARLIFNLLRLNKIAKLNALFEKFLASFRAYRAKPLALVKILLISFIFQIITAFCIFTLSKAINLEIALLHFFIFVPIVTIMEAIPLSIFGIGFRDAGYVLFFAQAGVPDFRAAAASMSLLYVACTVTYSAIGGTLFLFDRSSNRRGAG